MILESDSSIPIAQHTLDFFLARQPILDRNQRLLAYELLFRRAALGPADVTDDRAATAAVIANATELGMDNVIGDALGYVNVDSVVLMGDFLNFLPPGKVVLEILESVRSTPEILERVGTLTAAGYRFALDDVQKDSVDIQKMLHLISIIKIDITGLSAQEIATLATQFKRDDKILLAEKVETLEQFELCLMLGFDYFQGYYFARPSVMTGKILAPAQAAILQIMQLIESDAENIDIERQLKQDATLGLNLLRLVSTPGLGITRSIDSLSQALLILGRYQLQRWLQILLYAEHGKGDGSHAAAALLTLATTRGKQLELLAQKLRPGNRTCADMAYTVGIMSLVDTLLGVSMEQILTQLAVSEDVSAALLFRQGFLGELLRVAEYTEQLDEAGDKLRTLLVELGLSSDDLCGLQLQAYEWSFNISKQFH